MQEIFLEHLMMKLIMKFLKKTLSFPLTESLIKWLEIVPSFSTRPIHLKSLKLPNLWRPRNFKHTVIHTADTCGPRRKNQLCQSVRHTKTSRPFSQEVNFANSALFWTISRKSIPLIWFAWWKRHYKWITKSHY